MRVRTYAVGLGLAQLGSNWFKLVQLGSNWLKLVQLGSNWLKSIFGSSGGYRIKPNLPVTDSSRGPVPWPNVFW
jgi:hypothetical protein